MMMSELLQIRRIVSGGYNTTMKVVNTTPGIYIKRDNAVKGTMFSMVCMFTDSCANARQVL